MKIWKEFSFEASHILPPNGLHGHSYRVRVTITGKQDEGGMVMHMDDFERACAYVRGNLDHRHLNDFMEHPTLENLARKIGKEVPLAGRNLQVFRVEVWRPTCGDGAIWGIADDV
jgi:6-pyruvoyltetrahydropterin/6-carboxytetrahydropterin synthase